MEPSTSLLSTVLEPTAALLPNTESSPKDVPWGLSYCNPRNMVKRLSLADSCDWVYFGGDMNGSRFFVAPRFAIGRSPLRIDVFVLDQMGRSAALCAALGKHASMTTQGWRLARQDFVLHLLHALQYWSDINTTGFMGQYVNMPFGSRIVVKQLECDVAQCQIFLVRVDEVELQMVDLQTLKIHWGIPTADCPPELRLDDLSFQSQTHEAISLVTIPARHGNTLFVFKSTYRDVEYLYHEIQALLLLPSHPNIINKPAYIVSKVCRFGAKVGVCGFVQEFQPLGNLRDALRIDSPMFSHISLQVQYRWALELLSAMRHIKATPVGFFPDLKLDNVLLTSAPAGLSTLLIDFEQRGAWCAWSPPEVYYVDYICSIVESGANVPLPAKHKYEKLLHQYLDHRCRRLNLDKSRCIKKRGNWAWQTLTIPERELAMVYMFGKLMWCMFELQPTINCSLGPEIFREVNADHRFPEFRRTPKALQSIIAECTRGSKEWDGRRTPLVRIGDQLFAYEQTGNYADAPVSTIGVQHIAQQWWTRELVEAESFLEQRMGGAGKCEVMEHAYRRPTMDSITESLRQFGRQQRV